jgi:hypothetical protein
MVYVLMADDFADSGIAWAANGGLNGAISIMVADRVWNQIAFVNTTIDAINDLDVALGSDIVYAATQNGTCSKRDIWRHDGTNWERVFADTLEDATAKGVNPDLVEASPTHSDDDSVFLGESGTSEELFRSTDRGNYWKAQVRCTDATIRGWIVLSNQTVVIGGDS